MYATKKCIPQSDGAYLGVWYWSELFAKAYLSNMVITTVLFQRGEFVGVGGGGGGRDVWWGKGAVYLKSPGVHMILAYCLVRPAIFAAGRGREGECFFVSFISSASSLSVVFVSSVPLSSLLSLLSSPFLLGDNTKWPIRVDVSLNANSINQFF